MNIYLISEEKEAKQVAQLLKLNSECAKLHWSKTIELPAKILSSLETIESFVDISVNFIIVCFSILLIFRLIRILL